jgi:hypothetical protein
MVGQPIKCPSCGTVLAVPPPREAERGISETRTQVFAFPISASLRPENFIAEELEHEAKKRPAPEVEKRDPIDPTPFLATVGGTILVMILVGAGFYALDRYVADFKNKGGPSVNAPSKQWQASKSESTKLYDRQRRQQQLEKIAHAVRAHVDVYKSYPQSLWSRETDEKGRPRRFLSWRVKLLPYVGEGFLYNRFNFDEPWDSPHNLKLAERNVPQVYRMSPADQSGLTTFNLVVGPGTPANEAQPVTPEEVSRWPHQPALVVQVPPDRAVFWSKPEDWEYTANAIDSSLGFPDEDDFLTLLYDGSIKWISEQTPSEQLEQLMRVPKAQ